MSTYGDYCAEEKAQGRKPLSMKAWAADRAGPETDNDPEDAAVTTATIDTPPPASPVSTTVGDDVEVWFFTCPDSRFYTIMMESANKHIVNGQLVPASATRIEFNEHRLTLRSDVVGDREKAEWLLRSRDCRNGTVIYWPSGTTPGPNPLVSVQSGPRTSHQQFTQARPPQKSSGALTAPLNPT